MRDRTSSITTGGTSTLEGNNDMPIKLAHNNMRVVKKKNFRKGGVKVSRSIAADSLP
jgi:hypothetical protein